MKIQINKLKLNEGQVKGVPKNPRFIKDDKYEKLKKSLTEDPEFMDYNPVLIYDNNGELIVMGGNMRVRAAKELGWKEINGEVMPYDTPARTIRARIIKHNSGYGADDWDLLANEWSDDPLPDWGLDVPNDWNQSEIVEDEAPPVADVAISKLGEIYSLGRHRIMCGDSILRENIEKLMGEVQADMVFTDPPYGVDYSSRVDKDRRKPWGTILNDDLKDESLREFLYDSCNNLTKPKYICCNWQSVADFMLALGKPNSFIVWDKQSIGLGAGYRNQHEIILFYGKLNHNSESNVWTIKRDNTYEHPTQKPIAIPARAIKNSSNSNDNVLDIFLGSGSTLIACEQTGRTCCGMELDPKYVDVIRKRYWKFTHDNNEEGWEDGTPAIA